MASPTINQALTQTVADHIDWFVAWTRLAFIETGTRAEQAKALNPPDSFPRWYHSAMQTLPQDQPALDGLNAVHEQLHTFARLVLMKTPDAMPVASGDYDSVAAKYQEFMQGMRRVERAFGAAASDLDVLTGLRLRLGLHEDLAREHARFLRTGKPFCLGAMDIDHFKKINDSHGHDAGDRVLSIVANHITRGLRSFDDAYRVGGEEFILCLKDLNRDTGFMVLERLRAGLEKKPVILADGKAINVTASFGLIVSTEQMEPEAMIKCADQALYRAKEEGRNRIIIAA